ncbi:hypothetical protein CK218_22220 [Mesorhizobium sp. WSM3879]|uniref:hypothetical protein n=1 Tax=Mesorhizobium sp. WSM3879 TaxID=2029406 RepID=UPI000BAF74D8|nr:hypothetical protein [Mesorhizobium sp. WSM3879]PBB79068.1 hypothetical protein CK218_22220 [Mesorhizobium sp. WSM3879]
MDEVTANLVGSLKVVRSLYDRQDERWQKVLVGVLGKYLTAIGIDRSLADPLHALMLEIGHDLESKRRREAGTAGTVKPTSHVAPLAFAAAAVTTLKTRHGVSLQDALAKVSKVSGFDRKEINEHRNRLSRGGGQVAQGARQAHDLAVKEFRDLSYSQDDVLLFVTDLAHFCRSA